MRNLDILDASGFVWMAGGVKSASEWWKKINGSEQWQDGIFYALCAAYALVSTVALVIPFPPTVFWFVNFWCFLKSMCACMVVLWLIFEVYVVYAACSEELGKFSADEHWRVFFYVKCINCSVGL